MPAALAFADYFGAPRRLAAARRRFSRGVIAHFFHRHDNVAQYDATLESLSAFYLMHILMPRAFAMLMSLTRSIAVSAFFFYSRFIFSKRLLSAMR